MNSYTVFVIHAHDGESSTGQLVDATTLELIDTTVEKAMSRAKKLIKKKFYRLSMVIEKYGDT